MKRSSTIAQLADDPQQALVDDHRDQCHPPSSKWNYHDDVLATSMMLATISDENHHRRQARSGSMGSNVSAGSLSRCSSRASLTGWGSAASRKSYKVDLCSLVDGDSSTSQHHIKSIGLNSAVNHAATRISVVADSTEDSWGFFVDSNG